MRHRHPQGVREHDSVSSAERPKARLGTRTAEFLHDCCSNLLPRVLGVSNAEPLGEILLNIQLVGFVNFQPCLFE